MSLTGDRFSVCHIWGPEGSEGTGDSLRALYGVSKTPVCIMDAFRTEYKLFYTIQIQN